MSRTSNVSKNSVRSFFLLSYLISWAIWIPLVIYYYLNPFSVSLSGTPVEIILLAFVGLFGPTFAALIMAHRHDGPNGIKKLLSRWKIVRVGIQWYLVLPAINFVIALVAILINVTFLGNTPEVNWGLWYLIFIDFIRWMIIGGPIAEETGWRGYALPRLLKSYDALKSSLILGALWGFWHLPLLLIPGASVPVPFEPSILLIYVLNGMSLSIIFTWLYTNTRGSVFISYLFHAAANSIANTLLAIYNFGTPHIAYSNTIWFIMIGNWVVALILIIYFGSSRLSRKFKETSDFKTTAGMPS